jgi:hypothetical protein
LTSVVVIETTTASLDTVAAGTFGTALECRPAGAVLVATGGFGVPLEGILSSMIDAFCNTSHSLSNDIITDRRAATKRWRRRRDKPSP